MRLRPTLASMPGVGPAWDSLCPSPPPSLSKSAVSPNFYRHSLANIQVDDILAFEAELLRYIKANYPEIITNIETSKKIDEDTENLLKQAIPECVEAFGSTHTLVSRKEA